MVRERENPKAIYTTKNIVMVISPTPDKNLGPNERLRANEFVRLVMVVSKNIHKKAVVRNVLRRRIREAFRSVDKGLFENKHDYQIMVRQFIFNTNVATLVKDIEKCLKGEATPGTPEKSVNEN
jgi:ribonuclease P protein component